MPEDVVNLYRKAGDIAARVRDEAARRVKPGLKAIDLCEWVENRIRELGGQPAFPCNISVNEVAAHYSPLPGDEYRIPEDAVVKIDVGVHIDGYIADTAVTISLSEKYGGLLEAVKEALEKALEAFKPGTPFTAIGRIIESTIRSRGYNPIRNLSGHSLARYTIHAGKIIPNVGDRLVKGTISCGAYAIEPFGTTGLGVVVEREPVTIYAYTGKRVRARLALDEKKVLTTIVSKFKTLPFSPRWLQDIMDFNKLKHVLSKLARRGVLIAYPILVEKSNGIVAQFEHTVIVNGDEIIVTTRGGGG